MTSFIKFVSSDAGNNVKISIFSDNPSAVETAVADWMPYIKLQDFQVDTNDNDRDRYTAKIYMSYILIEQPNLTDEVVVQI